MKLALMLISLSMGCAAVVKTVELMELATNVVQQANMGQVVQD